MSNAPEQGCAVDEEEELFRLFESGDIRDLVAAAHRRRFALTPGANTADYLFGQQAHARQEMPS